MRMTRRQLAVFVAVAQEGTVTRASERVQLTQSAASMALLDLEAGLNAPLFDRIGKRLQLNAMGQALLPQAIEILDRCDAFERLASDGHMAANLHVGATLTIADYIIPPIIADFVTQSPQTAFNLKVSNTKHIIEAVGSFQLDVGLIEGSCHETHLKTMLWQEDQLVICAAPQHPLAQLKHACTVNDLAAVQWVLREEGSGTREVFNEAVWPHLSQVDIRLILGHTDTILKVVASGIGVSCVSRYAVDEWVKRDELVVIDTPFLSLNRPLYLVVHEQKYQSPTLKHFMTFCQDYPQVGQF